MRRWCEGPKEEVEGAMRRGMTYAAVAVFSVLLFVGGPGYYSARSFQAAWNLGHILYFALIARCLYPHLQRRGLRFNQQCLVVLALSLAWGGAIELIQGQCGRTPDIIDVLRDMIGGLVGICFLLPDRWTMPMPLLRGLRLLTLGLVAVQGYPVWTALSDEYLARKQFPLLSGFETSSEITRWSGETIATDDGVHQSGCRSLKVALGTTDYSGTSLKYFPGDWTSFKTFRFSLFNPSDEPLALVCRIHDRRHTQGKQRYDDRFNRSFSMRPGWNIVEIDLEAVARAPRNRRMDMAHIQEVVLFVMKLPQARVMYVDDVGLR